MRALEKPRHRRLVGALALGSVIGAEGAVARLPSSVVAPAMMILLAGIDIVGAVMAKGWSDGRSPWTFLAGAVLFVLLFWVYGVSLSYGHLSTITIGWVVLITVGSMGLDALVYDVRLPIQKWLAAGAVVALLVFLMAGDRNDPAQTAVEPTSDLRSDPAQTLL